MNQTQKAPWQKLASSDSKHYAAKKPTVAKPTVAKPKPSVAKAKSSKAKPMAKSLAVKTKAKPKVKAAKRTVASLALKSKKSAKTIKVIIGRVYTRGDRRRDCRSDRRGDIACSATIACSVYTG